MMGARITAAVLTFYCAALAYCARRGHFGMQAQSPVAFWIVAVVGVFFAVTAMFGRIV